MSYFIVFRGRFALSSEFGLMRQGKLKIIQESSSCSRFRSALHCHSQMSMNEHAADGGRERKKIMEIYGWITHFVKNKKNHSSRDL
jgi:hypothetical protein